ncbi:MAG: glycosyltransferase family 61 protein [Pseudomonadota bacterium]
MNFVTRFAEENVAHILRSEIMPLSLLDTTILADSEIYILKESIDPSSACQKWRYYVLSNIFSKVQYIEPHEIFGIKKPAFLHTSDGYNYHDFIDIEPSEAFVRLNELIKENSDITAPAQEYVLLNQRPVGNRYLIEARSAKPLEDYLRDELGKRGVPFEDCDFSKLLPHEQAQACRGASVFVSAHGAGCSNMIFTPPHASVIEYNFRKYWHCDPVCDLHFSGSLSDEEECGNSLHAQGTFHKADFRNLSLVSGRAYTELEVVRYKGRNSRNPISRDYMYVDGTELLQAIEKSLQLSESKKAIGFQTAGKSDQITYVGEPISEWRSKKITRKMKAKYLLKYIGSNIFG